MFQHHDTTSASEFENLDQSWTQTEEMRKSYNLWFLWNCDLTCDSDEFVCQTFAGNKLKGVEHWKLIRGWFKLKTKHTDGGKCTQKTHTCIRSDRGVNISENSVYVLCGWPQERYKAQGADSWGHSYWAGVGCSIPSIILNGKKYQANYQRSLFAKFFIYSEY